MNILNGGDPTRDLSNCVLFLVVGLYAVSLYVGGLQSSAAAAAAGAMITGTADSSSSRHLMGSRIDPPDDATMRTARLSISIASMPSATSLVAELFGAPSASARVHGCLNFPLHCSTLNTAARPGDAGTLLCNGRGQRNCRWGGLQRRFSGQRRCRTGYGLLH